MTCTHRKFTWFITLDIFNTDRSISKYNIRLPKMIPTLYFLFNIKRNICIKWKLRPMTCATLHRTQLDDVFHYLKYHKFAAWQSRGRSTGSDVLWPGR